MLLKGFSFILIVQTFLVSCARNRSLTFVIDNTGSMADDIDQVREAAVEIMNMVESKKGSEVKDVVLVTFNDPRVELIVNTTDKEQLLSALREIKVHGGRDCPEYALSGIMTALEASRQDSFLYVFTDAAAKDYYILNEVKSLCEKKQSQVVFVVTISDCLPRRMMMKTLSAYFEIARVSNGIVFIINKYDVIDIVNTIPDIISDQRSVISSRTIPASRYFVAVEFAVDDKTEYVTIHTSGSDVHLIVKDNKKHRIDVEKTLWKSTVKMVKFYPPRKGTYYAWVRGDSDVTVVVYAATDFTFDHGFSEFVPKSLADASKQPIADRKHHLSISVTDPKHTVNIRSAEILDMDETVIESLPLEKASGDFYITDKFTSPSHMFKIQVTGEVKSTGKEIKRMSKTAIEPQIPPRPSSKAPVVTITEGSTVEVDYAGDIVLTCKVSAYPKPKIWWTSADGTIVSETSNVVELPYDYISYLNLTKVKHTGPYRCRAQNKKGLKFAEVIVIRRSPFRVQTPQPETINVKYGEPTTIHCDTKSSLPIRMKWYYQKNEHSRRSEIFTSEKYIMSSDKLDLRIVSTLLDLVGKYTCEASLVEDETERKSFTTNVVINNLKAPEITNSNKTITVNKGDTMSAFCITDGVPKPVVTWQFKSIASDQFIALPDTEERISYPNIGYEKAGLYTCTATNALGSQNRTIDVMVYASKAPVVTITEGSTVEVDYAGDIVLTCKVSAYPKPKIWWTSADGTIVSETSNVVELPYDYISYLNLTKVKHTGPYRCRAQNKKGLKFAEVIVIRRSPFRVQTPQPETINVKYGEPTTIHCDTKSSLPIRMKWYYQKNEHSRRSEIFTSEKYIMSSDTLDLRIVSTLLDLVGKYTCEASLVEDETERKSFTTNVVINNLKAPEITNSNKTITVNKGDTMSAFCITDGVPKPVVTWQFKSIASDQFIALPDTEERISYPNIGYEKAGLYTCTATNALGSQNRTIDVMVYGVPRITNNDTVYYGVTGDKVLKIPCEVDGFPEPTITWRNKDKVVSLGAKLSVIKNAIYIKNPTEKDSNNYTCEAKNVNGYDTKIFEADISDFITYDETLNRNIYLKLGESADMECLFPHSDPNSIRWYVNSEKTDVLGTFYSLKNAQYSNDGNYTCRLNTDEGSESLNYVVDVGYKPSFKADAPATIDWNGNKDTLDCDVYAKPSAEVKWFYNGKPLNVTWPEQAILGWGQYLCKASNVHDSVQRTFNVTTYGCLINRTTVNDNHIPLLIDDKQKSWPAFATTNEFYTIGQNETITLECATLNQPDNTFQILPSAKRINAKCYGEDNFTVDKKTYKFSNLQCKADVRPSHVFTKESCMKNGEVIEIGFKLIDKFLRVYEVCYSRVDKYILYTKVVMSSVNSGNIVSPLVIKRGSHGVELKKCDYNLRRMVNPKDVAFGPAQKATLLEAYNSVPVYEPCDGTSRWSWSSVENTVDLVLYSFDTVTVWTGASQIDSSGIPRFLWKVVMLDDNTFETIVYVNAPNPSISDILCQETVTNRLTDFTETGDEFTYACSMDDFLRAFKAKLTDFQ